MIRDRLDKAIVELERSRSPGITTEGVIALLKRVRGDASLFDGKQASTRTPKE